MDNPWEKIKMPTKDANARRIDHTHPLDLFWVRDHFGRYIFVFEFTLEESITTFELPNFPGMIVDYSPPDGSIKSHRFGMLLKEAENWKTFLVLCNDLIHITRDIENPQLAIQTIIDALENRQEFLQGI